MSNTPKGAEASTEVIVVGASDTKTAAQAVERAADLAQALAARLVVVSAFTETVVNAVGVGSDTFVFSEANRAAGFADQTAARLRRSHGIEATGVVDEGKPEDVVLKVARQVGATLIVVGNVRMQGPGRLLGSVAKAITQHAPCDVLVVKTT